MLSEALTAERIHFAGKGGDDIEGYYARPVGDAKVGGVVLLHHRPGFDSSTFELARRFAAYGFAALCINLYWRCAPGLEWEEATEIARAADLPTDDEVVGDAAGAAAYLRSRPESNGRVGVIGWCSGGRHSFLVGCRTDVDAVVDCYGARVIPTPDGLTPSQPVAAISYVDDLHAPLLGLFGEEDTSPPPAEVNEIAKVLAAKGKEFSFHIYPDTGHAFMSVDREGRYRVTAAVDAWAKIVDFFGRHLAST